jgi:WD40 repeat protein
VKDNLKNLFHPNGHESSRKSSITSVDIDNNSSSEEENKSHPRSSCAAGPVYLKTSLVSPFKRPSSPNGLPEANDYLQKLSLNDDDYTAYLKKPKYIKTFKKSPNSAQICKRLFLAQELDQNIDKSQDNEPGSNLPLTDEFDTESRLTITSSADSLGGQNFKAKNKLDKKSVWALTFSKDGKYLASAGKGNDIKIWKVISSPLDRLSLKRKNDKVIYGPVFQTIPNKIFEGHSHDILSLDWSKNNFLLSSSMDKTVKLWTLKNNVPLRSYEHDDFVTCVKFHPLDDRFYISGCLDHKVRLWSILENEVSYEFNAEDLVTAVGFTPNGNLTIVGTFSGTVYFLDTTNLELRHSIQLNQKRSSHGVKITGIESYNENNDIKILLTSNDSKIRLLSLRNRQLELFFKGPENTSSQIIATVSDDQKYVISGSENHWVYVWDLHKRGKDGQSHQDPLTKLLKNKKKRNDSTSFHAHHSVVTCSVIAPIGTLKTLSLSNDFIYELNSDLLKNDLVTPPDANLKNKHQLPPKTSSNAYSDSLGLDRRETSLFDKSFIGSIIVTADDLGLIRVFRQDLSSNVRDFLIQNSNNAKSSKNTKKVPASQSIPDQPNRDHRLFLNTSHNGSSHSLLSRGLSSRKQSDDNSNGNFLGISVPNRSRSGTNDSAKNQIRTVLSDESQRKRGSSLNIVCDVCGGDKFSVMKGNRNGSVSSANGTFNGNAGITFYCSDCGNQIQG